MTRDSSCSTHLSVLASSSGDIVAPTPIAPSITILEAADQSVETLVRPLSPCSSSSPSSPRRKSSLQSPSPRRSFATRDLRKKLQQMAMTPAACGQGLGQKEGKLSLQDFSVEKMVGRGMFGRVHLAQSHLDGRFYAIKALIKRKLVTQRQIDSANNERAILRAIDHPFVVKLHDTFQDDQSVFFVMDYVPGGELFRLLRRNKRFSEPAARFYAAEVMLAIDYLHSFRIVYRDIKPENILLDAHGHVKLADFGFAKRLDDDAQCTTVCGTPDYVAPEIIRATGYGTAVDWWSFGVLIYELTVGKAPFHADNPVDMYEKILQGNVRYQLYQSEELVDLLKHLLETDPDKRYGNLPNGVQDIKDHRFFVKLDFEKVQDRHVKPPYIPDITSPGDSSCFINYSEPNTPYGSIHGTDDEDDWDSPARSPIDPFADF